MSAHSDPFAPPPGIADRWLLDPAVAYLNHGSFGACPREILALQSDLRAELEREPMDFLWRQLPDRLAVVRAALGRFLGCGADELAFVPNATAGVATVVGSLALAPGDELLTTDHAYGACRKVLEHAARRAGARVVVAAVPFPLADPQQVVTAVEAAATPRTRLLLLDHLTSATGLVFPVEPLVARFEGRGVPVLVDGAHAPGSVPLDLRALGASYATGNAHKWLCAPKGAAYLHVREDRRSGLHPLVISHGYEPESASPRFREEFDWTGTYDPTAVLCIPACIELLDALLPGGMSALQARNRALALAARELLAETLRTELPAPAAMIATLATVQLPAARPGSPAWGLDGMGMMSWLRARGVESFVATAPAGGGLLVRVSAQIYLGLEPYARLGSLLAEALGEGPLS